MATTTNKQGHRNQQTKARNAARREFREKYPKAPAHLWRHRWPLPE